MIEDIDRYMTSNIDEAAFYLCSGARIEELQPSGGNGNWVFFILVGVTPEMRMNFGNSADKSVGVPEFIIRRNMLKSEATKQINNKKEPWPNKQSRS